MDWKKYFCPVCGIDFTDDSDVVVCPDCGTPHHRECWKNNGHCFNEDLHGTEDSVECTYKKASSENNAPAEQIFTEEKNEESYSERTPYNNEQGGFNFFGTADNSEENAPKTTYYINGKPSVLYEIALKKNQRYYIPRFMVLDKGLKGAGWNFMAFFFPLAWSFYRKVYKLSAVILAVYIALVSATCLTVFMDKPLWESFNACYEEDPEFIYKVTAYANGESGATLTPNQQQYLKEQEEFINNVDQPGINVIITWGTFILSYVLRAFVAIVANKSYFKKINRSIDIGEKIGLQGDALKTFVYRKNGTVPIIIVAIIGFIEYTFMRL